MTLQEAALKTAERLDGQIKAILAANSNGGGGIVLPSGKVLNVKAPHPMDLTISLMQANSVLIQLLMAIIGQLSRGFVLSDEEAGRMAGLVAARMKETATKEDLA